MSTAPSVAVGFRLAASTHARASASLSPSTGSIQILAMASGFSSATVSISTPPSADEHAEVLLLRAVEGEAGVVLLGDVGGDLDPDGLDDVALDVEAEDVAGVLADLVDVGRQLHAAGLAAATDVDLGLDDHRVADALGDGHGLVDGGAGFAVADGDAVLGEELLALVLEEIHALMPWVETGSGRILGGCTWSSANSLRLGPARRRR